MSSVRCLTAPHRDTLSLQLGRRGGASHNTRRAVIGRIGFQQHVLHMIVASARYR